MENKKSISDSKEQSKTYLKSKLLELNGKECWGMAAGSGTGSVIELFIGKKIPLKEPVDNLNLSDDVRNNDAEFSLFIQCVWRLDSTKKVICGAWDDNSCKGKMLKGLKLLVNPKILCVNVSEPAFDLGIEFSNGLSLKVFCDQTNEKDKLDNYSLITLSKTIIVESDSVIRIE
jgi:hypothetical protein